MMEERAQSEFGAMEHGEEVDLNIREAEAMSVIELEAARRQMELNVEEERRKAKFRPNPGGS